MRVNPRNFFSKKNDAKLLIINDLYFCCSVDCPFFM